MTAVKEMFDREFGPMVQDIALLDEFRSEFSVGADSHLMTDDDARLLEERHEWLFENNQYKKRTDAADEFHRLLDTNTPKLDVTGKSKNDGDGLHLTDIQTEFFATYGVLPPITLEDRVQPLLHDVDMLCSGLTKRKLITSTVAWMFNKSLLELATSPEIVDKVSCLLGEEITFVGSDGPMYLGPGSRAKTPWHTADGTQLGGGTGYKTNLNLVSVWIAFSDAHVANGSMKIVPGSFHFFNSLFDATPELFGVLEDNLIETLDEFPYKIDPDIGRRILTRRMNMKNERKLVRPTADRGYNPFHSSMDRMWCVGEKNLQELEESYPKVALEAKKGQMYIFTSQNLHASFNNTTDTWRKAISLRYLKTNKAGKSIANQNFSKVKQYYEMFPEVESVFGKMGKSLGDFQDAAPRICVKGSIPAGQEFCYFDPDALKEELGKLDRGTFLPVSDPPLP